MVTHYNLNLWTNPSPDYSLYQRDYVATGETEPVETGRSRYRIQILFVTELMGTSKKGCVQHRMKCSTDLCLHEFCSSYWWLGGQLLKCKMHPKILLVFGGTGSVWGSTGWYLVILGQYNLVLFGIKWYWVNKGLLCLYILKKLMVTSTDQPTDRQGECRAICLFRKLENKKKGRDLQFRCRSLFWF